MEILHGFLFTNIILLIFFMNSSNVESRNHFYKPRNGSPAYAPTPVSPISPSPSYHKYPSPPPTIVSSHPSTAPASPETAGQGTSTSPEQCIFDVMKYGAIGDGETDDTAAFRDAWKDACAIESATILVPEGFTFMITSTIFSGPCKPRLVFQVDGILTPPNGPSCWPEKDSDKQWLVFYQLDDFSLNGTGTIEGKGQQWWELPCKPHKGPNGSTLPGPCDSPTLIRFFMSSNLVVTGLRIQNSPMFHMKFDGCQGVFINKLSISSPKSSPNTDGIHFQNTKSVGIFNSQISNGDDCISIGPGCTDVTIEAVSCGLGHGISIGSLGVHNSQACVSNITVSNAIIHDSENGVRIKTWQGGAGAVTGISFENIQMENVRNCVIIDQYYCSTKDCLNQTAAVYVNDVAFRNIKGTYDVRSPPIHFACSDTIPCTNITMSEVELLPHEGELVDDPFCWNTYGTQETITIPPIACLLDGMPELQAENYELGCA